jgi:hypothetical protein
MDGSQMNRKFSGTRFVMIGVFLSILIIIGCLMYFSLWKDQDLDPELIKALSVFFGSGGGLSLVVYLISESHKRKINERQNQSTIQKPRGSGSSVGSPSFPVFQNIMSIFRKQGTGKIKSYRPGHQNKKQQLREQKRRKKKGG